MHGIVSLLDSQSTRWVEGIWVVLEQVAQSQRPLLTRTTGVAVFSGDNPVLYIPVVRTIELSRLHLALWQATQGTGTGVSPLYRSESWMPHVTLAQGNLNSENLPAIIRWLTNRNFTWEITVNNVGFIYQTGQEHRLKFRFGFQDGTGENKHPDYN
jgi:2'-5' RNA ligase